MTVCVREATQQIRPETLDYAEGRDNSQGI